MQLGYYCVVATVGKGRGRRVSKVERGKVADGSEKADRQNTETVSRFQKAPLPAPTPPLLAYRRKASR